MPFTIPKITKLGIFLDGIDISFFVGSSFEITRDQANVHNSISFTSISDDLFKLANPKIMKGQPRIVVQINLKEFYFLLETREITENNVFYWGRDITAMESEPWALSKNIQLETSTTAKSFCENILINTPLNWEIDNWVLSSSFNASGTPVELIQAVISDIGAILRAEDDGSLTVKYPFPVRPINLYSASYDYECSDLYVMNVNEKFTFGEYYNIVSIVINSEDDQLPILELEDTENDQTRIIGLDSYVRLHFKKPLSEYGNIYEFTTDGILQNLGEDIDVYTEDIVFTDGVSSVAYPIQSIESIEWIGLDGGDYHFFEYDTDIFLDNVDDYYRIAKITYKSNYLRYLVTDHFVESLIVAYSLDSIFDNVVKITSNPIAIDYSNWSIVNGRKVYDVIDKVAEDITVNYINIPGLMIKRGEIFLDSTKYDYSTVSFEYPYDEAISDGIIIWLDGNRIDIGNYLVESADIILDGPKLINSIRAKIWKI